MTVANTSGTPVRQVVVVGGSLVGLSMAIALAHEGALVTVLERTPQAGYEGGGGLGVDVDLLTRVTGVRGSPPVCQGVDRATTAWPLLAGWLETEARCRIRGRGPARRRGGGGRRRLGTDRGRARL